MTTALFGFIATHHPAYQDLQHLQPKLYVNEAPINRNAVDWRFPDGSFGTIHDCGLWHYSNSFTVSPGSVLKLSNDPFWFGTRSVRIVAGEAELIDNGEFRYHTISNEIPIQFTAFGNPIAPEAPGQYIMYINITYESYIPDITGQGSIRYAFMFTVE